jgi:hypothetical protein
VKSTQNPSGGGVLQPLPGGVAVCGMRIQLDDEVK